MKRKNRAWTAKDFVLIAEILREIKPNPTNHDIKWVAVVNMFAHSLEDRFPNFDKEKFNKAITKED